MTLGTAVAIYFVVWWIVLFAVLPWGVRSQDESGEVVPGSDPGAPAIPRLGLKLIATTLVAGVVFGAGYGAYALGLFDIERLARLVGMPAR
jgi:predicted secreted protein